MSEMALQYKLRPFTVDEYHRMAESGALDPEERVELLDGALVEMSPISTRHWDRHADIVEYLIHSLGDAAKVAGGASLPLGTRDEPQPDIAILRRRRYEARNGVPASDIFAVVELSETSLLKDLGPKLHLYACHSIADYLVVDLAADVLLHHRGPRDSGYHTCDRLGQSDTFTLAALPGIQLRAAAFLASGI